MPLSGVQRTRYPGIHRQAYRTVQPGTSGAQSWYTRVYGEAWVQGREETSSSHGSGGRTIGLNSEPSCATPSSPEARCPQPTFQTGSIPNSGFPTLSLRRPLLPLPPPLPRNVPPPIMSSETFAKIHAASPIAHVHKVRPMTGVLLMIGTDDLRIGLRYGMVYHYALKGLRHALGDGKGKGVGETELRGRITR
ncbi:hypothetical protein F5887DRAFT_919382 [Amanita rubescens]|nr:hypothetical protein F5887DRAFT_919382 [Amanita rubescens]